MRPRRLACAAAALCAITGTQIAGAGSASAATTRSVVIGHTLRIALPAGVPSHGATTALLAVGHRARALPGVRRTGRTVSVVVRQGDVRPLAPRVTRQGLRGSIAVYVDRRRVLTEAVRVGLAAEAPAGGAVASAASDKSTGTPPSGPGTGAPTGPTETTTSTTPSQVPAAGGTAAVTKLLAWAPPTLTDPTTVTVQSGLDPDHLVLSTSRDYIVKLPPQGIHGTVEIDGGHNVVLVGGQITVPSSAGQTDNGADDTDTAIYVRGSTGTVHIEGVLITADPDTMFDGIDINAPQATVDIENVRMDDVFGSYTMEHADVIQTWGGARALNVDDLTADGDYQGFTIAPDLGSVGAADFRDVDLTLDQTPAALAPVTTGGGYMIWLTQGTTTCNATSTAFSNVYIDDLSRTVPQSDTAWPASTSDLACDSTLAGDRLSWPGLPVTGSVTLGAPPAGSFVAPGVAGNGYRSPGYATG